MLFPPSVNGSVEKVGLLNKPRDQVLKDVELLRTQSGRDIIKMRKWWHTDNPSIQGMWHPFTNRPTNLNVAEFPMTNPSLRVRSPPVQLPRKVADKLRDDLQRNDGDVRKIQAGPESMWSFELLCSNKVNGFFPAQITLWTPKNAKTDLKHWLWWDKHGLD